MLVDLVFPVLGPLLRLLPAEEAHRVAMLALSRGLVPLCKHEPPPSLSTTVWGRRFASPIGLAAGFDKDALAPLALLRLGFGFVEVGTVTPLPQPGNPKPRLFRLPQERALINRMGFNNAGAEAMAARLAVAPHLGPIGINIGKNKTSENAVSDYVAAAQALARYADYMVVNVSSPNTPNLRSLQSRDQLSELVGKVREAIVAQRLDEPPPLLVKIAPDLNEADRRDIADVACASQLDGLVVCNTTIERPADLRGRHARQGGGLSGRPLRAVALRLLEEMYLRTAGKLPLVGCGGVAKGADAYAMIRAGASLVQLYTAFIYAGPALPMRIAAELAALLARDGFAAPSDAVGAAHRGRGA